MVDLQRDKTVVDRLCRQYEQAVEALSSEEAGLADAEGRLDASTEALDWLLTIVEQIQAESHGRVSELVTRCLAAVFDDPYECEIRVDRKRGGTEARIVFVRGGDEFEEPLREVGGGVIDVAAFGLRLAKVLFSRPPLRKVMVLDEPFRNVRGRENRQRVRSLIEALAEETGVQFVLNVDADAYPEFVLGSVIDLE